MLRYDKNDIISVQSNINRNGLTDYSVRSNFSQKQMESYTWLVQLSVMALLLIKKTICIRNDWSVFHLITGKSRTLKYKDNQTIFDRLDVIQSQAIYALVVDGSKLYSQNTNTLKAET